MLVAVVDVRAFFQRLFYFDHVSFQCSVPQLSISYRNNQMKYTFEKDKVTFLIFFQSLFI